MGAHHLPSIEALTSNDDERLRSELRLSEVRENLLLLRRALDEIDCLVEREPTDEEIAWLGCRLVEVASVLARKQGHPRPIGLTRRVSHHHDGARK